MLYQHTQTFLTTLLVDLLQIIIVTGMVGLFYLCVFSVLYYLPGPNLSFRFPFKKIIYLILFVIGILIIDIQFRGGIAISHIFPITLSGNNLPNFTFHIKRISTDLFYPQFEIVMPFHKFDEVASIIVNILTFIVIASYSKFTLKLQGWLYYYFVVGTILIINIFTVPNDYALPTFAFIALNIIVAFIIHKYPKTVKQNIVVVLITLIGFTTLVGFTTENKYKQEQIVKQKEQQDFADVILKDPSKNMWKRFVQKDGKYSILYPDEILYEKNGWQGKNAKSATSFHIREEWNRDNARFVMTIWANLDIADRPVSQTSVRIYTAGSYKVVPIIHRKITRNSIEADQYIRESELDSEGGIVHVVTSFTIDGKLFKAEIDYPKNMPFLEEVYNDMWSSIEIQ